MPACVKPTFASHAGDITPWSNIILCVWGSLLQQMYDAMIYVSLLAVTQMSTRWHRCSNCTCVSCPSLWCPGLSTRTSWTAPTCWTPATQRFALFYLKNNDNSLSLMFNVCVNTTRTTWVCTISHSGVDKVGATNHTPAQNQLQPSELCPPVSRSRSTKHPLRCTEISMTRDC